MKSFASDNHAGVDPEILQAIFNANHEHVPAYGVDEYTHKAVELFKTTFGLETSVYFVCNGTAANTLALKACLLSHHAIICADTAHIITHEVGAPVGQIGCMLIPVGNTAGKISAVQIEETYLNAIQAGRHNNLPKLVSITQSTELGTIYSRVELLEISAICKKYKLIFHMDGCRLSNAAVALQSSLKAITADVGVDILSFGGTKNGLLYGEGIVFFRKELATEFEYLQKQGLQLQSKMRFLSAQFIPYLENNIWYRNAKHANDMALRLADGLKNIQGVKIAYPVQTNIIFAYISNDIVEQTQKIFSAYYRDEKKGLVRLVTSFDTTTADVDKFIACAAKAN